jgi:peptide-methionine (R)-S-oxide reductase
MKKDMPKNEEEWKQTLDGQQYQVLRCSSTETPFSGKLLHNKEKGRYTCAGCGSELFSSETKYDSGSGWPAFFDVNKENIETKQDTTHGMSRTEVKCTHCGGHLGHVFDDGPAPTNKRYCINSAALGFEKSE